MTPPRALNWTLRIACAMAIAGCKPAPSVANVAGSSSERVAAPTLATASWCTKLPRPTNAAFDTVSTGSNWFTVYRVEPGVFAIVEPRQGQEAISYLVVGTARALLFDTGIGLVPMRPVIERLTTLPVTVLNSHTHFDHVGANHEFTDVLGLDTPFSREHERGTAHTYLGSEVTPDNFCGAPPAGADTAAFRGQPWTVSRRIAGGDTLPLGGRTVEIVAAPGHTPDAIALLDRAHGLLFTGDSYYDATIWLFSPGTDLEAYGQSIERLAALAPTLTRLLPAHNTVSEAPARLTAVTRAFRTMQSGGGVRTPLEGGRERVQVGDVSFMIRGPSASARP